MLNLKSQATALLKGTVLVCLGLICVSFVYGVVLLIVSRDLQIAALDLVSNSLAAQMSDEKESEALREWSKIKRPVEPNHSSIVAWVLDCNKISDWRSLPRNMQAAVRLQAPNEDEPSYPMLQNASSNNVSPSHHDRMFVLLSHSLADQRMSLQSKVQSSFFEWQITSLITIALGMITTILVSFSSTEFGRGEGSLPRLIRLLAIIFPAIGTAAAAVVAFYSPQTEWNQSSRTLASLTQLHNQMAMGVWKLKCDDETLIKAQVEEWSRRYTDISAVANAAGQAATAGPSGPTPNTPAGPVGPPPPAPPK